MTRWIDGHEVPEGEGRCYDVEGKHVAVVNVNGSFVGMGGSCPCTQKALAEGGTVQEVIDTCPHREWTFDPVNGGCCFTPENVSELRAVPSQGRFWERDAPDVEVQVDIPTS